MTNLAWQLEEYMRVSAMMAKIAIANERFSRVREERLKFGKHRQQYVLLFHKRDFDKTKPLIFFLHGGGWGHGRPAMFRFIGRFFAEAGYPVILGGYRLAPLYKFPFQLEDAYAGLNAGLSLATSRGLRADRIILAGQSAGAQIASLMLLDRDRLHSHAFREDMFGGLLLISGLLNFEHCQSWKDRNMLRNYLGKRVNWPKADPIRYVRGDETFPVLCIHGERDLLVDRANSTTFINRLNHIGEIYLVPKGYHTDLTSMFLDHLPSTEIMLRWLERIK